MLKREIHQSYEPCKVEAMIDLIVDEDMCPFIALKPVSNANTKLLREECNWKTLTCRGSANEYPLMCWLMHVITFESMQGKV